MSACCSYSQARRRPVGTRRGSSYVGDDGVAIVSRHEVLHLAGRGGTQVVSSNEVWCQVGFGGITAGGAIAMAVLCGETHSGCS